MRRNGMVKDRARAKLSAGPAPSCRAPVRLLFVPPPRAGPARKPHTKPGVGREGPPHPGLGRQRASWITKTLAGNAAAFPCPHAAASPTIGAMPRGGRDCPAKQILLGRGPPLSVLSVIPS